MGCINHPERKIVNKTHQLCGSCYNRLKAQENPKYKETARAYHKKWRLDHPEYGKEKYWKEKQDPLVRAKRLKTQLIGNRRRKYKRWGLTEELFLKLEEKGCMICGVKEHLDIDHCHEQNVFRGLLCRLCNKGLGLFKDDIDRLNSAINYLKTAK